jgi:hypothetical protein
MAVKTSSDRVEATSDSPKGGAVRAFRRRSIALPTAAVALAGAGVFAASSSGRTAAPAVGMPTQGSVRPQPQDDRYAGPADNRSAGPSPSGLLGAASVPVLSASGHPVSGVPGAVDFSVPKRPDVGRVVVALSGGSNNGPHPDEVYAELDFTSGKGVAVANPGCDTTEPRCSVPDLAGRFHVEHSSTGSLRITPDRTSGTRLNGSVVFTPKPDGTVRLSNRRGIDTLRAVQGQDRGDHTKLTVLTPNAGPVQEPLPTPTGAAPPSSPELMAKKVAAILDPYGCDEVGNNPHASSHVPGAVNAEVRTTCEFPPVWIQQHAQLWEKRWWGWNKIGQAGDNEVDNGSVLSTFANTTWCHNGMTAQVTGSGRLMADDGHIYTVSSVSKEVTITNC